MPSDSQSVYEQLLVVRCQRGDRRAFTELIAAWERRLLFYVRRLLAADQDAQQVLQEVWLKALTGIGKLEDPARIGAWLYSLARYTAIDHIRDLSTRRQLMLADVDEPIGAETDPLAQVDNVEQIYFGLAQISVTHREILTLYFLNDLSVAEVADVLGIPAGTCKSRLYHARQALRAVLEREGGSES